jgi:hypothetical protein
LRFCERMVRSPPTLPFLADDLESHFSIPF